MLPRTLICLLAASTIPLAAQEVTQKDAITGKMFIKFSTRQELDRTGTLSEGSAAQGVRDTYFFTLNLLNEVEFDGKIARQPNLFTKGATFSAKKRVQAALFDFEKLEIIVINPKNPAQKKTVGRWTGLVPIDTATGSYQVAGSGDRPLRIFIEPLGRAQAIDEPFGGRIVGKADDKSGLSGRTYKRTVGGKTVEYTASKVDPLTFDKLILAKGPVTSYPTTTVNGALDYDYETGNYVASGVTFDYELDGKGVNDVMTGTIKWVDPKGNEKGYYDFNLRFNEEKNKPAQGVDAAFAPPEGVDAFFAVDTSIPALTGRIVYHDKEDGGKTVETTALYNLEANRLTKQQLMNFLKLWVLIVGPTNDE